LSMPDDPERLVNATPRSQVGELFASAARDLPSEAQLARLAADLGPVLGGAAGATSAAAGASVLVKLGGAAGALALLIGAGLALRETAKPAPTSATVTPSVIAPAVAAPPPTSPEPPSAAPTAESSASAPSSKSAPVHAKALSEAALLEQARRALASSPSYALQLANEHRARFPHGVLSQEREVIAIEALRRLQRGAEADQRAKGFSKAFPGSAHQRMVNEAAPK